ncbi:disease resistance-like protein DSC1 [Rutidosis leptorrhynchoides]|uniref:disease resistance-like protein DSC1 n=1 Tax=Rutidosis leptorrhynchoides TaxID=125765 RepID=UPI003A9973C6
MIGMKSDINTIKVFLKDDSSDNTQVLTLWGMAGIGKTYLADYIFKLHHIKFERSCFLEDIERRCTSSDELLDLQKRILKDFQDGSWMDVQDTNVGTYKIEKILLRKRTLLVLDGISKVEQLDALIGTKGLHPGCKLIITSKSESITEKCRLFETEVSPKRMRHFLEGLDRKESIQLLHWHAYGRNEPNEDDKEDSLKVAKYCNGHPLALKVLGSSIRYEDATWDEILESLSKKIHHDIQEVLQISFDSLPHEKDKELFKFIACFFVGKDKEFSEEILKASGKCRSFGIKNLTNRCLLTVCPYSNKLLMHQLLQDLGRYVVHQESPEKPWKRSLLWHHGDFVTVLQQKKGTTKIQGLVLDMKAFEDDTSRGSSSVDDYNNFKSFPFINWVLSLCSPSDNQQPVFETLAFSEMSNLRLLQLNYVKIRGSYKNLPKGLRWLCMHGFPLSFIPSELQMENMVALDMSNSNLQLLWKKPKVLKSLKFLNLSGCPKLLTVGSFTAFPVLERLTLAGCINMVEVSESIGNCHRLVVLNMSECHQLKKLPQTIGNLKNLRELLINGCINLGEFPVEMKDMESLEILEANNINIAPQVSSSAIVKAIPRSVNSYSISLPKSLVSLSLVNNNLSNESFPVDFIGLSVLRILYLDRNPITSLPDCVRSLTGLETLSLYKCKMLKTILCAPNTIKIMLISHCETLEKVTFYPDTVARRYIFYNDIVSLTEIQGQFKMQAISEIDKVILVSLGWINLEYVNYHGLHIACPVGTYRYQEKMQSAQILYEHGIFSTYLKGQEVPKSFTHRSNGSSSVILHSNTKNCRIRGLNVCIKSSISYSPMDAPIRIAIRNLTKNFSWIYQPIMYVSSEPNEVRVWLSHWMFENNEFEDGDEVSVHLNAKTDYGSFYNVKHFGDGQEYAHLKEYGISLVYGDKNKKEDPLAYYKSWNHIITRDVSAAKIFSLNDYLLMPHWPIMYKRDYRSAPYWPK